MWIRAEAADELRPRVTDVSSFRAVSWEDSNENCDVIDCEVRVSSLRSRPGTVVRQRTEGVPLRCGGSGGDSNGVAAREGLSGPLEMLYSGRDGVETLDMFAWPKACVARRSERRPIWSEAGATMGEIQEALIISWAQMEDTASGG